MVLHSEFACLLLGDESNLPGVALCNVYQYGLVEFLFISSEGFKKILHGGVDDLDPWCFLHGSSKEVEKAFYNEGRRNIAH